MAEAPQDHRKPRCFDCNSVGMSHCELESTLAAERASLAETRAERDRYKADWLKAIDHGLAQHIAVVREKTQLIQELAAERASRLQAEPEPLSPSPEIRYQLRNWHHVNCNGHNGYACNCWRQREKLIAELASSSRRV